MTAESDPVEFSGNDFRQAQLALNIPSGYEVAAITQVTISSPSNVVVSGFWARDKIAQVNMRKVTSGAGSYFATVTVVCVRANG